MNSIALDHLKCQAETQAEPIDFEGFLSLYDQYFTRLYTYMRYRLEDPHLCDDLVSQTFEQALVHYYQYDPSRGSPAAWLFGIARNLANAHLRRALKFPHLSLDALSSRASPETPPEEAAILSEEQALLVSEIYRLDPRARDLLALKFTGGLSNPQIALLTGLSEQNVAVILHRAIRQLRLRLAATEGNSE